jgi:predicted dehydrogenase
MILFVKFAVVGAGVIGQLRARSIIENPATTLIGIADADVARAQAAAGSSGARVTADYRSLVADPAIDAVIVATPVQFHEEMTVAALAAGKHVLCEKPLSNSVDGCRRILDAARTHARTLAVGFNHRYYPSVKFLKQAIDAGRIGTIDHVRVFGGHDGLTNFRADWMYKGPLSGGGAMMDVGIHMTDLTRYVLGDVREVYGVATNRVWRVEGSEDNAVVILKNDAGIAAFYHATWTEWKGYRFFIEVYGDRGMVRAYYAPMFNLLITQEKPGGPRKRQMKFYPEIIVREKLRGWTTTAYASFQEELADFLRMTKGERVPLADGWSGFRAVEIAHAVYQSTATGAPVTLARD